MVNSELWPAVIWIWIALVAVLAWASTNELWPTVIWFWIVVIAVIVVTSAVELWRLL